MLDLVRDSAFGHIVRLASGGRVFLYPEERDSSLSERYKHSPEQEKTRDIDTRRSSDHSDSTRVVNEEEEEEVDARPQPTRTRSMRDPESGKDVTLVDWFDENDPEVGSDLPIPTFFLTPL